MNVTTAVDLFLERCREHLEPSSVTFYRYRLKAFRERFAERELASLTPIEIFQHLAEAGVGKSDSTRRHNVVAFETLQSWALKMKVLTVPIAADLEKPRMGRRDRIPTAAETEQLLEHASRPFQLMYTALRLSGARPGELCRAQVSDWDRNGNVIVLLKHKTARKTGKPRLIPVSEALAAVIEESLAGRTEGPLFQSPAGVPWRPENLSRNYSALRDRAKLPKDLVLYLARHEAGTRLCQQAGIEIARQVLGHSNLSTTQRYVHLDFSELTKACNALGEACKLTKVQEPPPASPESRAA